MKLFHAAGACSQAPYIIINELGLKCEIVNVDFASIGDDCHVLRKV